MAQVLEAVVDSSAMSGEVIGLLVTKYVDYADVRWGLLLVWPVPRGVGYLTES